MSTHYVNNADFLAAIVQYKQDIKEAEDSGLPKPKIPEYIGECLLKIATKLATNFRFHQYTYKDEMILDGLENSLMYFDNFDPEKSSNPFAYYTQVIWWAFVRRINKEKKQMLVKGSILQQLPYDVYDLQTHDEDGSYGAVDSYLEIARNSAAFNDAVAKNIARNKKKRSKKKEAVALVDEDESTDATEDTVEIDEDVILETIQEVENEDCDFR